MFYPTMASIGLASSYATAEAVAAQSDARETQTNVDLFSHDIDRLLMITEAMWTLMKKEHGYTDDVLTGLIEEIDSRKVIVDGIASRIRHNLVPVVEKSTRPSGCSAFIAASRYWRIHSPGKLNSRPHQ